ncbi:MAG: ribosome-associated translation inhibitor RaiA [Bdellovibrionales bacterium]|nr:ribosome-associated translation inhibitor RaiA [Bdellovibrionales bacterium]
MSRPDADLNIAVTFRHTESTEALKQYASEKLLNCARKYVSYPTDIHIVLSIEKRDHIAEVQVRSKGYEASAKSTSEDLYAAIDRVVDAVDAQLRKQKERIVEHRPSR